MELKTLLNADYLDIIFDKRNKNYGSYELRKNYDRRMKKACLFLLLGVTALASFSFITARTEVLPDIVVDRPIDLSKIEQPKPKELVKLPQEATPPAPPVETRRVTPPKIVDDPVQDDDQMVKNDALRKVVVGPTNTKGDSSTGSIEPGLGTGTRRRTEIETEIKPSRPVEWVPQMPAFPGDLSEYISRHITYPEMARNSGIEGKVLVKFVVNEDGTVSDAVVMRGIGGGCDEEALRIVRSFPKWKAGKNNGIPVKVYFMLPFSFVLNQ